MESLNCPTSELTLPRAAEACVLAAEALFPQIAQAVAPSVSAVVIAPIGPPRNPSTPRTSPPAAAVPAMARGEPDLGRSVRGGAGGRGAL